MHRSDDVNLAALMRLLLRDPHAHPGMVINFPIAGVNQDDERYAA